MSINFEKEIIVENFYDDLLKSSLTEEESNIIINKTSNIGGIDLDLNYKFSIQDSGTLDDLYAFVSCGYGNDKDDKYTNTYILDEESLSKLIESFIKMKNRIKNSKKLKDTMEDVHNNLKEWIDEGIVDEIQLEYLPEKIEEMKYHYNPLLYKVFRVTVILNEKNKLYKKYNYSWIEVLNITDSDPNKYLKVIDHFNKGNTNIKVTFINYDFKEKFSEHQKKILEENNLKK